MAPLRPVVWLGRDLPSLFDRGLKSHGIYHANTLRAPPCCSFLPPRVERANLERGNSIVLLVAEKMFTRGWMSSQPVRAYSSRWDLSVTAPQNRAACTYCTVRVLSPPMLQEVHRRVATYEILTTDAVHDPAQGSRNLLNVPRPCPVLASLCRSSQRRSRRAYPQRVRGQRAVS